MIAVALILGFAIICVAVGMVDDDVSFPVLILTVLILFVVAGMCFDAGYDGATADYAHGRITIEKIPVVTKEIR